MRIRNTLCLCVFIVGLTPPLACGQAAAELRDRQRDTQGWPSRAVRASHGMVATDEELGSEAGVEILKRGGNAVDAAVAVAFALAVVEPAAGNIGGGGFMLVRLASGKTAFLDYREVAPGKATRDMYIGKDGKLDEEASVIGYRSVAVPGTVAGLALALKTYGSMKFVDVMAPAIRLAENGFPVSKRLAHEFEAERTALQRFALSRRIFLNDGKMFQPGDTLRAKYETSGHAWEVLTSPPPSSGGVAIIEALNMLQTVPLKGWDDVESVHMVAEIMRRVFADRAAYLADPDYSSVPVAGLTDPCYAKEVLTTVDPRHASSSKVIKAGNPHTCGVAASNSSSPETLVSLGEGQHTTHFSVVDAAGNAVASTYTLNDSYGSHVTSSAGFLLNDEMDDFTTQPGAPNALFGLVQSEANAIAPGHRPLSSMTPTILLRDGKLSFVTGSPGGPGIISATLLSVLNWMRLGMEPQAAINAPRFHHQWVPDRISLEPAFPDSLEAALNARGHATHRVGHIGLVNAIAIDPATGDRLGAADPRHDGAAVGY
jgi:gamma-glutamyltranspeptidase/glutathione hydrolase